MKQTVLTEGSGMKQRRKMMGRGLVNERKYLKLGKYKANKKNYKERNFKLDQKMKTK